MRYALSEILAAGTCPNAMKHGKEYGEALEEMMLAHNEMQDADEKDDWEAYNAANRKKKAAEQIIAKYQLQG